MALLIGLVVGLALFSIWLPGEAWAGLLAALRAQRVLVGMLLVFALIAVSLVWSAGQRLDTWIFLFLNVRGCHPRWLDVVMGLATQVGNMATAFVLAGLLFVLDAHRLAAEVVLGTLTLWLLVETIKALTNRARPFLDLEQTRIIGWRERGRSFPSGHTAQAFFLMTLLSHQLQPGLGVGGTVALYCVAALVGFTRMYVGRPLPARCHRRRGVGFRLGHFGDTRGSLLVGAVVLIKAMGAWVRSRRAALRNGRIRR